MLIRFDFWVLGKCTKFSHWLQRNTGLTNFFLAKLGVFFSVFSCIFGITGYFLHFPGLKISLVDVVFKSISLVVMYFLLQPLKENESRIYSSQAFWGSLMPVPALRLFYLFLSIMVIPAIFSGETFFTIISREFFSIGVVIYAYFSSVTPLPPGRSKIGQMVENFVSSFRRPVTTQSFYAPRQVI